MPLVGFGTGTVKNITGCRNFGTVTGKDYTTGSGNATGGIVGMSYQGNATITNCDNYGTYSAPTKSHIVGQYTAFTASGCDDYSAD